MSRSQVFSTERGIVLTNGSSCTVDTTGGKHQCMVITTRKQTSMHYHDKETRHGRGRRDKPKCLRQTRHLHIVDFVLLLLLFRHPIPTRTFREFDPFCPVLGQNHLARPFLSFRIHTSRTHCFVLLRARLDNRRHKLQNDRIPCSPDQTSPASLTRSSKRKRKREGKRDLPRDTPAQLQEQLQKTAVISCLA